VHHHSQILYLLILYISANTTAGGLDRIKKGVVVKYLHILKHHIFSTFFLKSHLYATIVVEFCHHCIQHTQ